MTVQYPSLFERLEPIVNTNLFSNTGTSQSEPNLFSNPEPDLFSNVEPNLFEYESNGTDVEEECTCYIYDTEHEDEVLPKEEVISNLYIVADQLAGLGHYSLSDIVESIAELV